MNEADAPEPAPDAPDTPDAPDAPDTPDAADAAEQTADVSEAAPEEPAAEVHLVDVYTDELVLARAQIDAGLPGLAEGTLRRRIAWLEAAGSDSAEEIDAARTLLAEALWRQHRLLAARAALDGVRFGSPQRRLPIAVLIEAEALASAGELDRATGGMERVVGAVGVDQAFAMRAGAPSRLPWPLPAEMGPQTAREPRPPWSPTAAEQARVGADAGRDEQGMEEARGRMEEARVAYVAGDLARGDAEMSMAVRLQPALALDGLTILEPTLGGQPAAERLLLYGDLLRAAGRDAEANQAFGRATGRQANPPD